MDKCVISVSHLPSSTAISFACSDGSVETRERTNFKPYERQPRPDAVINMIGAGFDFPSPNPGDICKFISTLDRCILRHN